MLSKEIIDSNTLITGEILYAMRNTDCCELINGKIVQMLPTGYPHGFIEGNSYAILREFVKKRRLGKVLCGEVGIYIKRNPDVIRAADVAYISYERLSQIKSVSYLDVAPELIVEVLSPNDSWRELTNKLEEYFSIGVNRIWVVDPHQQQVYVYRSLTEMRKFNVSEHLLETELFPNFQVLVADFFE